MRVFRQTLVLTAVFIVVLGFYFLYIKPREEKTKKAAEAEKKLVNLDQEKIYEIQITKRDGEKIVFRREGKSRWNIVSPILADADKFSVNPIVSRFSSIEIERLIDDKGNFSPYGVDNPRYVVEVKAYDQSVTLYIGNKSQVGYSIYVRKSDDIRVFLVSAALESVIDKPIHDFREKRPMDFIVSDVESFKITRYPENSVVRFEREEESTTDWKILFPGASTFVEGDETKVRDLLYKISGIKVKEFVSDLTNPTNLYGLDKPDMRIDVTVRTSEEEIENLSLLLKLQNDTAYAKKPDKPNIFTLEFDKTLMDPIVPDDLRNKQVLKYYVWRVKEVSIETPKIGKIIQRDPVDTEKWYLLEGGQKKNLETAKVKEALRKLSEINVLRFLGDNVDVSAYVSNPTARIRINVEGKAEPYYLVVGEKTYVDGVSGIVGGLMDKRATYLFPLELTSIVAELIEIRPSQ